MKMDCSIIKDLLPLYEEKLCSPQSNALVEEHLKECAACRRLVQGTQELVLPQAEPADTASDRAIRKGFRKIRRRWWASVLLAVALIPLLILGWNQLRGAGVDYTNLRELMIADRFMRQLSAGNYEKAFGCLDLEPLRRDWLEDWFEEKQLESLEEDGKKLFCEYGQKLEELGGIQGCRYVGVSDYARTKDGRKVYLVSYLIDFNGKKERFELAVTNAGVEYLGCGGSWITDPLARFTAWSEYLWESYRGCYFDPVKGEYVYPGE